MAMRRKKRKGEPFTPTPEMIKAVFNDSMFYEILFTFSVPSRYRNEYDYYHWEIVNFSRMAHARILYLFLVTTKEQRNHKKVEQQDDVIAADFGYVIPTDSTWHQDLKNAWKGLNKRLLHLSYGRIDPDITAATKPWPDKPIKLLVEPIIGYMEHVKDSEDLFASKQKREAWVALLGYLRSGKELQAFGCRDENNLAWFEIREGEPYPDGKPGLTKCYPTSVERLQVPMKGSVLGITNTADPDFRGHGLHRLL